MMKTYTIVKHKKTGNLYKILANDCMLDDQKIGVLQDTVIYRGYKIYDPTTKSYLPDPDKKIWAREKSDFYDRFVELTYNSGEYRLAKCRETGNIYKILSLDECKLKNSETREWQEAVIYQSYIKCNSINASLGEPREDGKIIPFFEPAPDDRIWIMEKNEFKNKFEII